MDRRQIESLLKEKGLKFYYSGKQKTYFITIPNGKKASFYFMELTNVLFQILPHKTFEIDTSEIKNETLKRLLEELWVDKKIIETEYPQILEKLNYFLEILKDLPYNIQFLKEFLPKRSRWWRAK